MNWLVWLASVINGKKKVDPEEAPAIIWTWLWSADGLAFWRFGCLITSLFGFLLFVMGLMGQSSKGFSSATYVLLGIGGMIYGPAVYFGLRLYRTLKERGVMNFWRLMVSLASVWIVMYFVAGILTFNVGMVGATIIFGGPIVAYTLWFWRDIVKKTEEQVDRSSQYGLYIGEVTHQVVDDDTEESR